MKNLWNDLKEVAVYFAFLYFLERLDGWLSRPSSDLDAELAQLLAEGDTNVP